MRNTSEPQVQLQYTGTTTGSLMVPRPAYFMNDLHGSARHRTSFFINTRQGNIARHLDPNIANLM